jgi:hypothetical protein
VLHLSLREAVLTCHCEKRSDEAIPAISGDAWMGIAAHVHGFGQSVPTVPHQQQDNASGTRPRGQSVRWASAAVISMDTAVMSCTGTNGLAIITLLGTPFDGQSWKLSPLM